MRDKKKIIAIIIAVVAVIGLAVVWCAWRQTVTRKATVKPAATASVKTSSRPRKTTSPTPATTRLTDEQKQQALDIAARFEHAAHDWGADPAAVTNESNNFQPGSIIDQWAAPTSLDETTIHSVSSIPMSKTGWDSPSRYCLGDKEKNGTETLCNLQPNRLIYWGNQHFLFGAHLDGEPTVTVDDNGTVTAEGKIRMVIWSTDLEENGTAVMQSDGQNQWTFTPYTGTLPYKDTLTIKDGKVTNRKTATTLPWIADPWYGNWSQQATASVSQWKDVSQPTIILTGDLPPMNLHMDSEENIQIIRNNPNLDD